MTMQLTTKRLTTTVSALSLGFLLSGSLAMAADAPTATLSTAPPPATTYPHWTPEERQQHWEQIRQSARDLWAKVDLTPEQRQQYWEQIQQSARDLWAKWGLTPEQRQQYWEQMQQGWQDLKTMMSPPAETPPTAPAMAAVAPETTLSTAPAAAATYPPKRVYNILALWRMTAQQRQQYWEYMQQGGKQ